MNLDAVRETYDLLAYRNVRWAAIDPRTKRLAGGHAQSRDELALFAHDYRDWNFYVQPNPTDRIGGSRVCAEDVTEWRWFIVDIDPLEGCTPPVPSEHPSDMPDVIYAVQAALQSMLGRQDFYPGAIYSGRGYQLWYRVNGHALHPDARFLASVFQSRDAEAAIVVADVPTTRAIAIAQKYWLDRIRMRIAPFFPGLEIDLSVSDLPRLARCPGTVNHKTGNEAFVLRDPAGALEGVSLLRWVPTREYMGAVLNPSATVGADAPWQAADAYITKRASAWLNQGEGEPGRHWGASATARSLAEAGVSEAQIVAALEHGGALCRPPLEDNAYILRTAREAIERVNRKN